MKWVEWRDIPGTGCMVSNEGKIMLPSGRIHRRIRSKEDYETVGKPINAPIHQLVAYFFLPHPNAEKYGKYSFIGYHVHHINGDKKDNRVENLQYLTVDEHKQIHGRHCFIPFIWKTNN